MFVGIWLKAVYETLDEDIDKFFSCVFDYDKLKFFASEIRDLRLIDMDVRNAIEIAKNILSEAKLNGLDVSEEEDILNKYQDMLDSHKFFLDQSHEDSVSGENQRIM